MGILSVRRPIPLTGYSAAGKEENRRNLHLERDAQIEIEKDNYMKTCNYLHLIRVVVNEIGVCPLRGFAVLLSWLPFNRANLLQLAYPLPHYGIDS